MTFPFMLDANIRIFNDFLEFTIAAIGATLAVALLCADDDDVGATLAVALNFAGTPPYILQAHFHKLGDRKGRPYK